MHSRKKRDVTFSAHDHSTSQQLHEAANYSEQTCLKIAHPVATGQRVRNPAYIPASFSGILNCSEIAVSLAAFA
jgi:hypothetical protein